MRETEGESAATRAEGTPSLDLVFDLLSNRRRRYALYYLNDRSDGVATVDELTDNVLALECGEIRSEPDSETSTPVNPDPDGDQSSGSEAQRLRVQTELQHVHLPKLEDAGVLEHDPRSQTVRYWTQPSIEEWLEHAYHKEVV